MIIDQSDCITICVTVPEKYKSKRSTHLFYEMARATKRLYKPKTKPTRKFPPTKAWLVRSMVEAGARVAGRVASKKTNSKTKTQTKRRTVEKQSDTPGAILVKTSSIKMTHAKGKYCPNVFMQDWQQVYQTTNGIQLVALASYVMPRIGNGNVSNNRTLGTGYATDLFEMSPRSLNATTSVFSNSTTPTVAFDKFFLGTVDSVLTISSLSKVSMVVDVYWCAPVKNHYRDPVSAWNQAINVAGDSQTIATAASAPATTTVNPGYLANCSQIGVKPTDFKNFKDMYNIKKKDHFILEGGQIKEIKTKIHYNKTITNQHQVVALSDGTLFLTGQTLVPVIVARSAPVLMQFGTSPGFTEEMVFSETKIGVMHRQIIRMATSPEDKKNAHVREFVGTLQGANPVNEIKIIDEIIDVGKAIFGA